MKFIVVAIILSIITVNSAKAQSSYREELLAYQDKYKKDLFEIIKSDTAYVKFFPIDTGYKVVAKVQLIAGRSFFSMPTSNKSSKEATKYALISFSLNGKEQHLYAYQLQQLLDSKEYHSNFFIPFMDGTTGNASYTGGRYIDFVTDDIKNGNTLILDFNKAYNPYCAFKKGYNCPVPPEENRLTILIPAGEMDFAK